MANAIESARRLAQVATQPGGSFDETMDCAGEVLEAASTCGDASEAIRELVEAIDADDAERAGVVATVAGALVERGADSSIVAQGLLKRLDDVSRLAEEYADVCREHFRKTVLREASCAICDPGEDEAEMMSPSIRSQMREKMPEGEAAWVALDLFCRPAVTVLLREPEFRLAATPEFVLRMGLLAQHQAGAYWVFALTSVLHDEVLRVYHAESGRAFDVEVSGVADNFQLILLLAEAMQSLGIEVDEAPSEEAISVADGTGPSRASDIATAPWNMFAWTALREGRELPDGYFDTGAQHMIWNEGIPADIPDLDGRRIVILAKTPYVRGWTPSRMFEGLPVRLKVERELDAEETERWCDELVTRRAELSF